MDPKLAGFWRVVTNTYNAVGLLYTIITGVYSAVADVLAWLFLPSATLALYCTFGILIGSLAGFFLLPLKWEAKPKDEQVRAIKWHFTAALIAFAVFVLYVQSLSASFAESNVIIEFIREAFLQMPIVLNVVGFFLVFFVSFFSVTALTIFSVHQNPPPTSSP